MFDDNKYVGKDIKAIREEIIEFIKLANEDWTDFNMSSIQLQYTDILAGVADMLCYYLDNQALETFLSTARQAKNIKGILTTMNYKVPTMGTAQGEVTFSRKPHEMDRDGTVVSVEEGRFLIPKYTKIGANSNQVPRYLTLDEVLMDNNKDSVTVPVIQGNVVEVNYPVQTIAENFKLYITERQVPLEYVEIVDEGWEKVEDAFTEIQGGMKYSVHADSKDMIYILFTYDWTRYLSKEQGAVMKIRYVESLGTEGKVESGELCKILSDVTDIDTGESVQNLLFVTNDKKTFGAFDTVNLNKQKANARNYLKTYDRIILLEDLETMVRKEGWVKDCVCYDWRRNDTIVRYPHQMKAWVVTVDGADSSTVGGSLIVDLTKRLQAITVAMTEVEVLAAEMVNLDFKIGIEVAGNNETIKENIRAKVEQKINERYCFKNYIEDEEKSKLKFGMSIDPTKLEVEVGQLNSAISSVSVGLTEVEQLTEIQFFNISRIEVYLM